MSDEPVSPMTSILVVDDEAAVRRLLAGMLERAGYEVREAADGAEAVRLQTAAPADLVILDMVMPEQEGAETARALRRAQPALPLLAISGAAHAEHYLSAARMLGADAALQKPFTREALLREVERLLGPR
jgi:CheY-like chemotaxis protein